MSSPRTIVPAAAAALLLLAGCNASEPAETDGAASTASTASAAVNAASDPSEAAPLENPDEADTGKIHLKAGETATAAAEGTAVEITVSNPQVIPAPEGWSGDKVVIATVTINLLDGEFSYDETGFALVQPDGTKEQASTVASDTGLPAQPLGSGSLTAPDKAKGIITFSEVPTDLTGVKVRWTDSPAGYTWDLG